MSGKCSGVAARIRAEAKHAIYVHCNAHCLNLVIVDAVKAVPEADCFFVIAAEIVCAYVRFVCSPEMAVSSERHVSRCTERAAVTQCYQVGM